MKTRRLFELGLSFGLCKRMHRWPSIETMNSFLKLGKDDGALGADIEWDPCELTEEEYKRTVDAFMQGEPYKIDTRPLTWEEWRAELR